MPIKVTKDILWKGIIEDLIEDFLSFFFEPFLDQIALDQPIDFLDQELEKLFPESTDKNRRADKLVKVQFKSGQSHFFLIHIEVQGYDDPEFARRMFQCYYRIIERYGFEVTSLVLYTNKNRRSHFKEFRLNTMGTLLQFKFNTFVLIDHPPEQLALNNNVIAILSSSTGLSFHNFLLIP